MKSLLTFEKIYTAFCNHFRLEIVWEMYSKFNKVTWDNVLKLEAILIKQNLPNKSEWLKKEWSLLLERDYPNIYNQRLNNLENSLTDLQCKIIYLLQPGAYQLASIQGQYREVISLYFAKFRLENAHLYDPKLFREFFFKSPYAKCNTQISLALKANYKLMLECVKENGFFIEHVSQTLKDNKDIVMAAVLDSGMAIKYTSARLKCNPEIINAAINETGLAINFLPYSERNNKFFAMQAAANWGLLALKVDLNDKDIVLAGIKKRPRDLKYASINLRQDVDVILTAMKYDLIKHYRIFHLVLFYFKRIIMLLARCFIAKKDAFNMVFHNHELETRFHVSKL